MSLSGVACAADFGKMNLKKDVNTVKKLAASMNQSAGESKQTITEENKKNQKVAEVASTNGTASDLEYAPDNLTSFTQCAGLELSNVMVGYRDTYTFQQGFTKEKRSGFIKRQKAEVKKGCILPSLKPMQFVYMEVDEKKFDALGSSNDWAMQCIKSANPEEGAVGEQESKGEWPYHVDYLAGKDMMLHCGNSEGIEECATGSNSSRSGAWDEKLRERGKIMLSVYATTSTLAPATGEKLYCQYYNKKSGKSLFGFEYLRKRP
jgi:hypothetical protein